MNPHTLTHPHSALIDGYPHTLTPPRYRGGGEGDGNDGAPSPSLLEPLAKQIINDAIAAAMRANCDPGSFTPRADDHREAMGHWQARARVIALAPIYQGFDAWFASVLTRSLSSAPDGGKEGAC